MVTGRHDAGTVTGPATPDWYDYTGRHEAPPVEPCRALVLVDEHHEGGGGWLVCNLGAHEGERHHDQADGIYWELAPDQAYTVPPAMPQPAAAVA